MNNRPVGFDKGSCLGILSQGLEVVLFSNLEIMLLRSFVKGIVSDWGCLEGWKLSLEKWEKVKQEKRNTNVWPGRRSSNVTTLYNELKMKKG